MRIDREAWFFVIALALVSAVSAWLLPWLAPIPLILAAFTVWFFRDPERRSPSSSSLVLGPADGKVIVAGPERISVFMNVFNVHVCRAPCAGQVRSVEHHRGRFLAAFRDDAPEENERTVVVIETVHGPVSFVLVAGLVARRIVCRVRPGQRISAGERIGLIRFGSRVDLEVPPGTRCAVSIGDRCVAGVTVIARWDAEGQG